MSETDAKPHITQLDQAPSCTSSKLGSKESESHELKQSASGCIEQAGSSKSIKRRKIRPKENIIPSPLKFGFLGIGELGSRFVLNLLKSRHQVFIWNRTVEKCEKLEESGAEVLETPFDVVIAADIIFTCLRDEEAVKDVLFGYDGVLSGLNEIEEKETKGFVEMSSLSPETSQSIHDQITRLNCLYLEARIMGGYKDAEEGTLFIITSGCKEVMEACSTCFKVCGQESIYLGEEIGKASKMHSISRSILGVGLAAVSEAMALAETSGLNLQEFTQVIEECHLTSPFIKEKWRAGLENNFEPDLTVSHLQNDIKLSLNLADSQDQHLRLAAISNELFKSIIYKGYGNMDVAATFHGARNLF